MLNDQPRVRQNYLAIVIAAITCFLFEAGWYSYFLQTWLHGIGRTQQWLDSIGVNLAIQFATALLAEALIATAISCVTQLTGPQTAMLWLGLVLPALATEYVFEVRTYTLFAINTGFWLVGMTIMGAIVGAWKKKQ